VEEQDWHGVCDAVNDLREIEVEERLMAKEPLDISRGPVTRRAAQQN
jgi:hypothetical protein